MYFSLSRFSGTDISITSSIQSLVYIMTGNIRAMGTHHIQRPEKIYRSRVIHKFLVNLLRNSKHLQIRAAIRNVNQSSMYESCSQ
jgi:hypothetical protein